MRPDLSIFDSLLINIVDYAGLFPPAALPLEEVVANYARYRESAASWMLARIIIPASRLEEFATAAQSHWTDEPWPVSALVPPLDAADDGFEKAFAAITAFNSAHAGAVVDAVEIKCPNIDHVAPIAQKVPDSIRAFLEVPHAADPQEHLRAIADTKKLFAKIRTGGMTSELIPSSAEVARFLMRCAELGVGLKATAGLHHPLRNEFNLTYQPDSPRGVMHGYLNVFCAAAVAFNGGEPAQVESILECRDIGSFTFDDGFEFDGVRLSAAQLNTFRNEKAISFGSCSFEEPVEDLRAIGFQSQIQAV